MKIEITISSAVWLFVELILRKAIFNCGFIKLKFSFYVYFSCDVSNRDEVLKLAEKIKAEVGLVSVLVNNVGIMPTHPLERHTPEEIRRVFEINVYSQFWTIEAFLPQMKQQGRGHIVCMSSIAGVVGLANLVPYCATKFAVRGMMEALHEEFRDGPYRDFVGLFCESSSFIRYIQLVK